MLKWTSTGRECFLDFDCGVYAIGFLDCRPSQGHVEPGIRMAYRAGKRHNATDKSQTEKLCYRDLISSISWPTYCVN